LWSCFSAFARKTALIPSPLRGDISRLTQSQILLRGLPHILGAAARGVAEFTADEASFKDSADHCAMTPLHVFIMISKEYYQIFKPKF
jgi:hypothetical protein